MAIARHAGIDVSAGVMTGEQLTALDENARREAAVRVNVFARAAPDHKLVIVRALQASGQLVAMTGDGVNDAPALKVAHVGIAMGAGATDVAREASALVVTNEDFGVIASGILLGRRVFENLRRAVMYIIAVHVPIAISALAPVLFGLPSLLFPVHVMFLELVIDPACSVALEAEQPDQRTLAAPPRSAGAGLFVRMLSVGALIVFALSLIIPPVRDLFQFAVPPLSALAGAAGAAIAAVLPFDLAKRPRARTATV